MEDLYIESFVKQNHSLQPSSSSLIFEQNETEIEHQPQKREDSLLDMLTFLDRLEREIEKEYPSFADYQFLLKKIRESIKKKSIDKIIPLLDNLEQLLDIELPSIYLKRQLNP